MPKSKRNKLGRLLEPRHNRVTTGPSATLTHQLCSHTLQGQEARQGAQRVSDRQPSQLGGPVSAPASKAAVGVHGTSAL